MNFSIVIVHSIILWYVSLNIPCFLEQKMYIMQTFIKVHKLLDWFLELLTIDIYESGLTDPFTGVPINN